MIVRLALLFPALIILLICIGLACSGGPAGPTQPSIDNESEKPIAPRNPADIYMGGLWEVAIDKASGEVSITSLRTAGQALNVLGMLEPPVLFFLSINLSTLELDPTTGYVGANVILNHPIYSPIGQFKGFDVRGIVFGPYVENADGYTPLLRPSDFYDIPFGYIDGLFGVPADWANFDEEMYGYKYFADGLSPEQDLTEFFRDPTKLAKRGMFSEGSTNVRHYDLYFNVDEGQFLIFNYAVLVSYDFPSGLAPYELSDYSIITANAAEPFNIKAEVIHNSLYYDAVVGGGGTISIDFEVFDWQNLDDVHVQIESPGVIPTTTQSSFTIGTTAKSGLFSFVGVEGAPLTAGTVGLIITAIDNGVTFGESFFLNFMPSSHSLYNEHVYTGYVLKIPVDDSPGPWVGPVQGETILGVSVWNTFIVDVESVQYPSGPFEFTWENGDDDPPVYDDGDGGNNGTIDLSYSEPGIYTIDCKVTDLSNNEGTSIYPLTVVVANIPPSVGELTLEVNRWGDYSIKSDDNISLNWDAVADAEEYAIYYDPSPMDGSFDTDTPAGVTTQTEFDFTLYPDAAAVFVVKGRGLTGFPETEGPPSEYAFVDFEQAEAEGSEGSWENNSVYDNPNLQMQRSSNFGHRLNGQYGWYDSLGSSIDYINSYEVFYSDIYPEIPNAGTFLFEVAHRVYNYNWMSNQEDGYAMGYMIHPDPPQGLGPDNFLYFIVTTPMSGPNYWPNNDAMRDEFTYSMNPDAGYTYSYWWRLSVFNVNMLQWPMYGRVAIGHATDAAPNNGSYIAVDDIAVIIY